MQIPIDGLPEAFLSRMQKLLQEEYLDFLKSYDSARMQGLRVNPLKISAQQFAERSPFLLQPIPWVANGFFYADTDRPGKHPYHDAGVYYIQEPSAMAVGELLGAQPRERILDLCAAPGGKSTHIASLLRGEGLLVSNEIHPQRAKILSQNIERFGISNAVVTNESPQRLMERFPLFFDRIVVDAPCSGEGMFRKDEQARSEWSPDHVVMCANRQTEILDCAYEMLRPGGRLIYSTCTFAPEENEGSIQRFLDQHPDCFICSVDTYNEFSHGCSKWIENGNPELEHTIRLWPHRIAGEGHFIAVLQKSGDAPSPDLQSPALTDLKKLPDYLNFCKETLTDTPKDRLMLFGDQLYRIPEGTPNLNGLKVLRPGLHLGTLKKNRFEPAHALALALRPESVQKIVRYPAESTEIAAYLHGESLQDDSLANGWHLICTDEFPIGWGKCSNGILKNHYPKGLRRTESNGK